MPICSTAVDEAAEQLGLTRRSGAGAGARHASRVDAIEEDAEADAALLEKIADWCLRYTPLVTCDAPDGLLLDISGCAHLYGGEHELVADLGQRVDARRLCLPYRHCRHDRRGLGGRASRPSAGYAGGEERVFCRRCRLAALRLRARNRGFAGARRLETHRRHRRSAARPLTARFGGELLRQLDRALGPRARAAQSAPAGRALCRRAALSRADRARGGRARHRRAAGGAAEFALERRGDGARRIELTLFRTDGAVRRIAVGARGLCATRTTSARCSSNG